MTARIVVIDSDQFMRKVFTICLNDAGWNVWGYDYSHIDLWPSVKQHKPDLIILNFTRQNGGAGWQFLQMIKMDDATAQIPILVTTTVFPLAVEMRSYLLARYIQIVYQPFDVSTFIRLIQRTLMQASQGHVLFSGDRTFPVLVVEDNQDLQEGLETVLMLEGFQVATANNGLLALEAVYTAEHCLIFLDIRGWGIIRFNPTSDSVFVGARCIVPTTISPLNWFTMGHNDLCPSLRYSNANHGWD